MRFLIGGMEVVRLACLSRQGGKLLSRHLCNLKGVCAIVCYSRFFIVHFACAVLFVAIKRENIVATLGRV